MFEQPLPIVAYQAKRIQIIVIGAGGTGSWVVQHLARLVWDFNRSWERVQGEQPRRASLRIVDFDTVEMGNLKARQNFCPAEVHLPKARVLAHRYALAFGLEADEISSVVVPFSRSVFSTSYDQLTILVGCVDRASARAKIAACVRNDSPQCTPMTWWIDAGNALHHGQVLMGNTPRIESLQGCLSNSMCLRLPTPDLLHPELLRDSPEEQETKPRSCKDLVLAGEPEMQQSRTINNHMAALVYAYVEMLIYGGATTFATYTDLRAMTSRSLIVSASDLSLALGKPPAFFTDPPTEA